MRISERNPSIMTSSIIPEAADEPGLNAKNPVVVALQDSDIMIAVN